MRQREYQLKPVSADNKHSLNSSECKHQICCFKPPCVHYVYCLAQAAHDWLVRKYEAVWIRRLTCCVFSNTFSLFFGFFARKNWLFYCKQCIRAQFTDSQISLFNNFFIKNESPDTVHTFKNYFATVFSNSIFSFSKNKLNPNGPIYSPLWLLIGESWYLTLLLLDGRSLL